MDGSMKWLVIAAVAGALLFGGGGLFAKKNSKAKKSDESQVQENKGTSLLKNSDSVEFNLANGDVAIFTIA